MTIAVLISICFAAAGIVLHNKLIGLVRLATVLLQPCFLMLHEALLFLFQITRTS